MKSSGRKHCLFLFYLNFYLFSLFLLLLVVVVVFFAVRWCLLIGGRPIRCRTILGCERRVFSGAANREQALCVGVSLSSGCQRASWFSIALLGCHFSVHRKPNRPHLVTMPRIRTADANFYKGQRVGSPIVLGW